MKKLIQIVIGTLLFIVSSEAIKAENTDFRSSDANEEISIEVAWERFLKVCGLALSDPDGYLTGLPNKGLFGEKVLAEHKGKNLTTADLMNGRIWESVVIADIDGKKDIDCHFHFTPSKGLDFKEMAQQFVELMEAQPNWKYAGGYGEREYPFFSGQPGVSKSPAYHYSILNVWERKDISVEVSLSQFQVYLGASAILNE